jgi:hypothetical protein
VDGFQKLNQLRRRRVTNHHIAPMHERDRVQERLADALVFKDLNH